MEIWRDIKGYENLYEVSNLGNVKSLKYNKERILRAGTNKRGYLMVVLCKNNIIKTYAVHQLVALAFLPNPDNLPCVNHKDEQKTNNKIDNLEWCDSKYNNTYGNRIKKSLETKNKNGSINAEKQVIQLTKDGIEITRYKSIAEAERQTGISNPNICSCCNGKRKSAGGFIWKYL